MGYMTEISFLNDNWHEISKAIVDDPQKFVQEIQSAMNGKPMYERAEDGSRVYLGHEIPAEIRLGVNAKVKMYPSHHADSPKLYLAFQNMFLSLDPYDWESQYGARIDAPNDHITEVLERFVGVVEGITHRAAQYLREKREDREAGVG